MIEKEMIEAAIADAGSAGKIGVQVCYATPTLELLLELQVATGTTLEQAIAQSGLLQQVPQIDLATAPVGIYAKKKPLDTVLRAHDRIEVYRPLIADPKEARRRRASRKSASI
jgi:putative ubiquitin-RnfH superfamily antitoxin RatB of RatAB toxin-antitoxin module